MATKPPTSKTTKRAPSSTEDAGAPSSEKTTKKATVSLIDDASAKKKRTGELKTGSSFTPLGAKPAKPAPKAAAPAVPAGPPRKTLDQHKAEALNLFDEDERKAEARRSRREDPAPAAAPAPAPAAPSASFLPPISLLREEEPKPAPVVVAAPAPVVEEAAPVEEGIDPKVIHLKPPIIVRDLAERMGLKTFNIIKDLMGFQVFAKADTAVEPEVATKVCEMHGFIFEKEKREKGGGVHKVEEKIVEPP
ncbi:MAG TPA: translation initiation factor IF-2 N-terminal domain-containing protein, partial [Candidatus Saccharimonadia bacterium]|nr:translation initiation factor IF-2 N-terminal domain-containing protein [Candidatus Saccharimonadia bacterium]